VLSHPAGTQATRGSPGWGATATLPLPGRLRVSTGRASTQARKAPAKERRPWHIAADQQMAAAGKADIAFGATVTRQDLVGVARRGQPGSRQEPEGDKVVDEAEVIERAEALPGRYADRIRPQDLDGMRSMAEGGEWQELVHVLLASLAIPQAPVTAAERDDLRSLAEAMELPTGGLAGLNVRHR
jgi:hypothetical protein